jgi:hypothetical protein
MEWWSNGGGAISRLREATACQRGRKALSAGQGRSGLRSQNVRSER